MSKFFSFCKANNKKHGLKDQSIEFKNNFGTGSKCNRKHGGFCWHISVFIICLIFLVSGFYVFQITSTATYGFGISEQEKKISHLKLIKESLSSKTNNFEDLSYIQQKADELGLVMMEEVEYLEVNGGVALK